MNPQRVVLPCGCAVTVDHESGERRVVCPGGGLSVPEGVRLVDRSRLDVCPGSRGYCVTAERVETVVHTVRPLEPVGGEVA